MAAALPWISTAISAYGAVKGSQAGKVSAPAQRNYLGEMQSALQSQGAIQSDAIGLEAKWTPEWQKLQEQTLSSQLGTLSNVYGVAGQYSQGLQNAYLGMQAPIYGQVGQAARNAYQQTLDPTTAGLYASLSNQASAGLANGRNLSDQELRMAQGQARAAMAARGLQYGNQGIAAEVLGAYNLANAREDRARAFAGQVYGIGQNNASQAMSMYGTPLMSQLNQVSPVALLGTAATMQQSLGPKLFQPESQYNAGVYGANQSNDMNAALARSQANAGFSSGLLGLAGNVAKGYLSNPNLVGNNTTTTTNSTPSTNTGYNNPYNEAGGWTYSGDGASN
jgi:hypothetical protein